ncbi:MAG: response regulator [Candidatus Omnitrophota bacterium]|nr:MAG: response regulator [Candidatus Omnitrophota bacterium]
MSKKILFIEDEPDEIMMVRERFGTLGYEVVVAMDGEEGMEMFFKEKPDLVLIDVIIPKIDGFVVCRQIRQSPNGEKIPIVLITAAGMLDFEEKSKQAEADAYLRRPYESATLDEIVKNLLEE